MTGLPDGLDLQPGDDPAHVAAVANHALNEADHRELAEMIGVPVVPAQALATPKASPESLAAKPRRKPRCRACGYLRSTPGHKRTCGGA